jgi:hypothetical protein
LQLAEVQIPVPTTPAVTLADAEWERILGVPRETGWVVSGRRGPPPD